CDADGDEQHRGSAKDAPQLAFVAGPRRLDRKIGRAAPEVSPGTDGRVRRLAEPDATAGELGPRPGRGPAIGCRTRLQGRKQPGAAAKGPVSCPDLIRLRVLPLAADVIGPQAAPVDIDGAGQPVRVVALPQNRGLLELLGYGQRLVGSDGQIPGGQITLA